MKKLKSNKLRIEKIHNTLLGLMEVIDDFRQDVEETNEEDAEELQEWYDAVESVEATVADALEAQQADIE